MEKAIHTPWHTPETVAALNSRTCNTMASQSASQASQDTEDGLADALNGVALTASQDPEFDKEEGNYESSQTEVYQETIASEEKDEFTLQCELEDMLKDYLNKSDMMASAICHVLAMAIKLEDFRMVCIKLNPTEFPNLVACSGTLTPFHIYLVKLNPRMPKYKTFS